MHPPPMRNGRRTRLLRCAWLPLLVLACLLLGACLAPLRDPYPDWHGEAWRPVEVTDWSEFTEEPITASDLDAWADCGRLLLVVPGVSSGAELDRRAFCDQVGEASGADRVLFYDWYAGHFGRRTLLATTTQAAAERLVALCRALHERNGGLTIDLLAHSGGTVVAVKAGAVLAASESSFRFRHLLFMGSPLDPDTDIGPLLERCTALLNVHSHYDKVIRTLGDESIGLPGLPGSERQRNIAMDRTLGGLLLRHEVYLQAGPELPTLWGLLLGEGRVPDPKEAVDPLAAPLTDLYRHALWLREQSPDPALLAIQRARIVTLLQSPVRERQCFGVIFATLLRDEGSWAAIKPLLQDPDSPPWLRRQIHRYLVALEDSRYIDLLRWCRKRDPANAVETRDALRDLKRAGVERVD